MQKLDAVERTYQKGWLMRTDGMTDYFSLVCFASISNIKCYLKPNPVLYSRDTTIPIYILKHNDDTIRTSGHSSLEKYTSHFIERVVSERWVGDWTELQHMTPPNSSGYNGISFPFSWAAQPGVQPLLGHGSHSSIFFPTDLNFLSLELIWHLPTSCERHNSHLIQPVDSQAYPPISSTGCTCYLHWCIFHLTARPGRRSICNTRLIHIY